MTRAFYAVIGSAVALGGLILNSQRGITELRRDVGDLRERMARMEGRLDSLENVIVQVFSRNPSPAQS
ncbi:MAG: hypothetical protein OXB98_19995 [Bryobacterales bacterium]|nr:hypothetical protein [Bryobacterales bacterium]